MIKIDILYQDKHIIVCVKPVGVLSEDGGMPKLLSEELGGEYFCVHRLDRAVSGIMVYAKTKAAASKLTGLLSLNKVNKEYLAVVQGQLSEKEAVLKDLLFKDSSKNKVFVVDRVRKGVKEAELDYSVLQENDACSLVKVRLHTGRTHQIRVQFSSRRHPLYGDVKYGSIIKDCDIALFSHALRFPHPITGKIMEFTAYPEWTYPWNIFIK